MSVVTRFAPSPTGFLHIGGARTALFNWLFARHHGGQFLLRIEDTDRERSTQAAIDAILDGLNWLGLDHDGEVIYQFARAARHAEVAHQLLAAGKAYYCYTTPEELTAMREAAQAEGRMFRYPGIWRDRDPKDAPAGIKPVIRIKAPTSGEITVNDLVQGQVTVACSELDDMVLLRSDGTPTYMLAVVVDDHDMAVTHVIRGDDHLTNAFRQRMIYDAMGWNVPEFAHIPLIHGPDGAKLSKRHGALGVEAYRDMGYLPEALRNYLLRLGWSHGDAEIISAQEATQWFGLDAVGRSPSRFDFAKLEHVNAHYVKEAAAERLVELIWPLLAEQPNVVLDDAAKTRLIQAIPGLKPRAKTLIELAEQAQFYVEERPILIQEKPNSWLEQGGREVLAALLPALRAQADWSAPALEALGKAHATAHGLKLPQVMMPLRAALTGRDASPGMFEVMAILGQPETLARIEDAVG